MGSYQAAGTWRSVAPWIAVPFLLQVAILVRHWYNAPMMDDYDSILLSVQLLKESPGALAWLKSITSLHNEHRASTTRLAPYVMASLTGSVDFRTLLLFGPLYMLGAMAYIWLEFRRQVAPVIAGAAAFLLFQYSYTEALLQSSGALPHLGVVFFSIAGLYFATRPGWKAAATCAVFGVLAAFSQANGLLMLPLAAAGCFLVRGMRARGAAFAVLAAATWAFYFSGYVAPSGHPPVRAIFWDPVRTMRLLLVNVGGILPNVEVSQAIGAMLLIATAVVVVFMRLWRNHLTVLLWLGFVLGSAASVTVGRAGFGLFRADRYAVYPALLMAILLLAAYAMTSPWSRRRRAAVFACAVGLSLAMTAFAWPQIRAMSVKGRLLVDLGPSSAEFGLPRFVGTLHPNVVHAINVLKVAERLGTYHARRVNLYPTAVEASQSKPSAPRRAGEVHVAAIQDRTVVLQGWTDIPATVPSRRITLHPADGIRSASFGRVELREDAAIATQKAEVLLGGLSLRVEFASEEDARRASRNLCVYVDAPGYQAAVLPHPGGGGCP